MTNAIMNRVSALINVKSIMTLILTAVFAYLSVVGAISPEQFVTIFTMIVGFYFGVQHTKREVESK